MIEKISKSSIFKSSVILFFATLISRILGFTREIIIAVNYGLTEETDAFYLAFTIPELLNRLLVTGALGALLIPIFSELFTKKQEQKAHNLYISIRNVVGTFTLFVSIVVFISAEVIIDFFAKDMINQTEALAVDLLRIMIFSLFLLSLSAITKSYLNSIKIFAPSAYAPVIQNVIFILISLILVGDLGLYTFAIAYIIAVIIQYLFQQYFLSKYIPRKLNQLQIRHEEIKRVILLSFPALITLTLTDLNVLIDRLLGVRFEEGSTTAITYANKLIQLPVGILASSIVVVLFPYISSYAAENNLKMLRYYLSLGIKTILLITFPILISYILLGEEIVGTMFEYGSFNDSDTFKTYQMLIFYSIGLPFTLLMLFLIRFFHGYKDVKSPMYIGIAMLFVKIFLLIIMSNIFGEKGLVLSTSLAAIFGVFSLFIVISRKVNFKLNRNSYSFLIKLTILGLSYTFILIAINKVLSPLVTSDFLNLMVTLVLSMFLYIVIGFLLKIQEISMLLSIIKKKLKRK